MSGYCFELTSSLTGSFDWWGTRISRLTTFLTQTGYWWVSLPCVQLWAGPFHTCATHAQGWKQTVIYTSFTATCQRRLSLGSYSVQVNVSENKHNKTLKMPTRIFLKKLTKAKWLTLKLAKAQSQVEANSFGKSFSMSRQRLRAITRKTKVCEKEKRALLSAEVINIMENVSNLYLFCYINLLNLLLSGKAKYASYRNYFLVNYLYFIPLL